MKKIKLVLLVLISAFTLVSCQVEEIQEVEQSKRYGGNREIMCQNVDQRGTVYTIYLLNGSYYRQLQSYGQPANKPVLIENTNYDEIMSDCAAMPGYPIDQ